MNKQIIKFLAMLMAVLAYFMLWAMPQVKAQEALHIDIYGPGQPQLNLHLAASLPLDDLESAQDAPSFVRELQAKMRDNLKYLPFLRQVAREEILLESDFLQGVKGEDIDFEPLRLSRVDMLLTLGWRQEGQGAVRVELRLFDVFSRELLVGRGYVLSEQRQIPDAGNRFSAEVMQELTGHSGFFRSQLAFVRKLKQSKEIYTSTPQGDNLFRVSDFNQICLSPAWSWDGEQLAFTLVGEDKHELAVWDRQTRDIDRILLPANTIISPTFSPKGDLVVSADPEGNPDIFMLDNQGRLSKKLAQSWAIDISPDFDQSGEKMVFVSSRLGNPHIFLMDLKKNQTRRISYEGTYNTNPSISPDGRFVAYSRQTPQGHRIIMHDLQNSTEKQLTHGPGNDEEPAWGPDSFFLAFSSDRSGEYKLYLTTRHADQPRIIPTGPGQTTFPAWNPSMR